MSRIANKDVVAFLQPRFACQMRVTSRSCTNLAGQRVNVLPAGQDLSYLQCAKQVPLSFASESFPTQCAVAIRPEHSPKQQNVAGYNPFQRTVCKVQPIRVGMRLPLVGSSDEVSCFVRIAVRAVIRIRWERHEDELLIGENRAARTRTVTRVRTGVYEINARH